jgi:hypothetical protein
VNPVTEKQLLRADVYVPATSFQSVERFLKKKTTKMDQNQHLDQILESAVVANWPDLMRRAQSGLIHIEYGLVPTGTLDYVQVWSSITRGHWLLACAWMSDSTIHGTGVYFENGYESEGLAHILELVIAHQNTFAAPRDLGRAGLLQIATPTREESVAAATSISGAFDHATSAFVDPIWA